MFDEMFALALCDCQHTVVLRSNPFASGRLKRVDASM